MGCLAVSRLPVLVQAGLIFSLIISLTAGLMPASASAQVVEFGGLFDVPKVRSMHASPGDQVTLVRQNVLPGMVKAVPVINAQTYQPRQSRQSRQSIPHIMVNRVIERIGQRTVMRSGPGSLFSMLRWAEKGASLVVDESRGEWLHVRMLAGDRIGWIQRAALQSSGPAVFAVRRME